MPDKGLRKPHHDHQRHWESVALAWILGIYLLLCFIIAGLNFGYAPGAGAEMRAFIYWFWHFYENEFKTAVVLVSAILSWRIARRTRPSPHFGRNLIGLSVAALLLHIVGPWVTGNHELYFFSMPFPWTSVPLQVLDPNSAFFAPRAELWGLGGALTAFGFWVAIGIVVFVGTLIQGRRWQCSTLCMFNGFAAEIFSTAFPLIGKPRRIGQGLRRTFTVARWVILAIALFYSGFWITHLAGLDLLPAGAARLVSTIETWKYLVFELLMAMLFWMLLNGRGYCQYCSLGTVLAGLGRIAGQRIETNLGTCVSCGKCNRTCPLGIDVMRSAAQGSAMRSSLCVGCGHCVDQCPVGTLRYTTHVRDLVRKK